PVRAPDRARLRAPEPRPRPAPRGPGSAGRCARVRRAGRRRARLRRAAAHRPRRRHRARARADGRRRGLVRAFAYFIRSHPWQSLVVLLCLLLAAVAEGIGVSALLPALSVATGAGHAATGFERAVRSALATVGIPLALGPLSLLIGGAMWLKAVLSLL